MTVNALIVVSAISIMMNSNGYMRNSILTHKSIPENKSVSIRSGSGGEPAPARFPTASPVDGGGRFSLLELE